LSGNGAFEVDTCGGRERDRKAEGWRDGKMEGEGKMERKRERERER